MKVTVDLEDNGIVGQLLMESYKLVYQDIRRLESKESLQHFEVEDLEDFKELRRAMKKLLRYYLVRDEANKFIKEVEDDVG